MKNKEWIPVTQLLPKNGINVLMCEDDNMYVVSMFYDKEKEKRYWEDDYGYIQEINNDQAWMQLPSPYKPV